MRVDVPPVTHRAQEREIPMYVKEKEREKERKGVTPSIQELSRVESIAMTTLSCLFAGEGRTRI